jgi:arabinose-5-phosphate isomerase
MIQLWQSEPSIWFCLHQSSCGCTLKKNLLFLGGGCKQVQAFTQLCLDTKGVIFFSGVGKSGFVAQKIAQTLVSTGTKAVFLSPTDALHGDIGIMGPKDILVLFSKSGATEELNRLAPCARARGAYLVGVSSLKSTNFRELCDMHVYLPLERELCPFDLAPVTSTAIQMLFGDTVAIALMQAKNLTREQYALNHPAGRIGKRLIFRVSLSVMLIYLRLLGSQFALPDDKKMLYL